MKTYLIEIKSGFAQRKKIPNIFVGVVPTKTDKAVYVYGHGSMITRKTGRCCVCGRTLTHPVSVVLGIGPQCGGHWWDWKAIGGYTEENIERLKNEMKTLMKNMLVDSWMPRSVIISAVEESEEVVQIPEGHKMMERKQEAKKKPRVADLIQFKDDEYGIRIRFPYDQEDLAKVKSLDGRRWNSVDKEWTTPLSQENVLKLQEWNFEMDPKLLDFLKKQSKKVNAEDLEVIDVPGLKMDLYPYQKQGVAFIEAKGGRALVADEMGLGKTCQALAWLQKHPEHRPAVIVVPASLKLNWAKEIKMWMSDTGLGERNEAQILSGTQPYEIGSDIAIINYDILQYWLPELIDYNPQVMIADEAHYFKTNKALRTKAVKKLGKLVPHFIALTGTPIVNRPIEILNAVNLIDPMLFPKSWSYIQKYCAPKNNGYGWDLSGSSNTKDLHQVLTNSIMIRRLKENVLPELPAKTRAFTPIYLRNRAEYSRAQSDFISFLKVQKGEEAAERASNAAVLSEIEGLKQLAVQGKLEDSIMWIRDFLESGEKLVVMAVHKFVIDRLMQEFGKIAVKIDGSVSNPKRQVAVDKFQNEPETRLFVGNIKAAGVGITLTAASNVAFLELPWTPGDLTQAEDRIHRIGQDEACTIHYLLAQDTIEDKIARLLDSKRKILDAVLDGRAPEEGSLLTELMNEYA